MSGEIDHLTDRRLRTPRAAAVAGILFALLLGISIVLIRVSIPADPADGGEWLKERANTVALALSLVPFAGLAFLWFIGVVRDRIGRLEDRFFSSVFFGTSQDSDRGPGGRAVGQQPPKLPCPESWAHDQPFGRLGIPSVSTYRVSF